MQTKQADIIFKENQFFVTGELNLFNVMSVYEKSLSNLQTCPELHFDFSQVKSSDSAGLALIIEWIKFSKSHHKPIQFQHLSHDIMSIAKAAGIDGLITNGGSQ